MTTVSYRDAAAALWGEAGAYAHDAYARLRDEHYPELPAQLPIVIGITAYSHVAGLCGGTWEHGPRITLESRRFAQGRRWVDDLLTHEMLHAWLHVTGQETGHKGEPWYEAVRRLSPAALGRPIDVRRGADRKSVRVAILSGRRATASPGASCARSRSRTRCRTGMSPGGRSPSARSPTTGARRLTARRTSGRRASAPRHAMGVPRRFRQARQLRCSSWAYLTPGNAAAAVTVTP